MKKLDVLITGSSGIIGHTLAHLYSLSDKNVAATYHRSPPDFHEDMNIQLFPLIAQDGFSEIPAADLVIHGAGHTHLTPNSSTHDYVAANIVGMERFASWARAQQPRLIVFLSTVSVYGKIDAEVLTEETPLFAPEAYGASKYFGELILQELSKTCPVLTLRLPGVVGPKYFTPWIGKTALKAARGETISIFNPESLFNNIVDIEELYRIINILLARDLSGYTMTNVAAGQAMKLQSVVELIVSQLGSKSRIEVKEANQKSFSISSENLEKLLGGPAELTETIIRRWLAANQETLRATV